MTAKRQTPGDEFIYLRPASGGIHRHSQLIERLCAAGGPKLQTITIDESRAGAGLRGGLIGLNMALFRRNLPLLAEVGFHSTTLVWALLIDQVLTKRRLVLTIHEAEPVLESLFPFRWWGRQRRPVSSIVNRLRRLLDKLFRERAMRWLVRSADQVITLSPDTQVFGRHTSYLPLPLYVPEPPDYQPPSQPAVGFLGYWGGAKGIEVLIQAAGRLHGQGVKSRWVVAGSTGNRDDDYSRSIRRLARQSGAAIEFPGPIPEDDMLPFLQSLSVLVIPYRRSLTGIASGMAVWAANAGVPVIASDTPALRAALGEAAAFVPPDDPVALGEAIAKHLASPEELVKRAAGAQTRITTERSDEVLSRQLSDIITAKDPQLPEESPS